MVASHSGTPDPETRVAVDRAPRSKFRVGAWTVAPPANEVSLGGETTKLEPKVMAVLV